MNENVTTIIQWWKLKGAREKDPFVKFFFLYVCFDAWLTAKSGEDTDQKKIRWLVNDSNGFNQMWSSIQFDDASELHRLKLLSPVKDMRPNHNGDCSLSDIKSMGEVIRFIYQIRCNLFHGSKSPDISRDEELVSLAGIVLEKWIVSAFTA